MRPRAFRDLTAACVLVMGARAGVIHAAEGTHDFSRYQIILDRAPFGQMSAADAAAQQPPFSTRFTFMGIAKAGDDKPLLAIILDKERNQMRFVSEGDTIGSVSVVKIEKVGRGPAKVVLKQGLELATLVLEPKAGGATPAPGPQAVPGQPPQPGQVPGQVPTQSGGRRLPFRRGG